VLRNLCGSFKETLLIHAHESVMWLLFSEDLLEVAVATAWELIKK